MGGRMDMKETSLLDFLGEPGIRFSVPLYQRAYSWEAAQCDELWRDLLRLARTGRAHFAGAVMYVEEAGGAERSVVDGQQRLTALTLLLAALHERVGRGPGAGVPGAWIPLEERAAAAELPATLDDVLHAWLAERYRGVRILDAGEVYGVFKACLRDVYAGSLDALLVDVGAYLDRLLSDDDFRAEAERNAEAWTSGKPEKSVSEFKKFGG